MNCDWNSYGSIFCNPPYSKILPWVMKTNEECRKQIQSVVMLLPADISVKWFCEVRRTADEVKFIENGRINFIPAGENKKRTATR
ncbi:MAG: DNA N-6-adenine-methyltransferase [Arsenophonus endosymbiont of Dermacentor nuttalli]